MDEGFYHTFASNKESKKDVQIDYIMLGDLLEVQGSEIMKELSDKKHLNIMNIPFIKYLVLYQWSTV